MFNDSFYPTPPDLVRLMVAKIKGNPRKILEPSAGKGNIVDALLEHFGTWSRPDVSCIELDVELQATLRGKGHKVLDSDFLKYSGPDKFDLIIANPPFDDGDKHLLKAIDIMYRGQIIFLLNAETLRNQCTSTRKELWRRLDELGAEVQYIQNAFRHAERKTDVEIAMVNILIDRKVEDDLFDGCEDHAARSYQTVEDKHEISTGRSVQELVAGYNRTVDVGQQTILGYFRNFKHVSKYIGLNREAKAYETGGKDLTDKMQGVLNDFLKAVRTDYWRKTLDLKEVRSRLTTKKQEEFEHALTDRCHMDFTESNIRQFVINLIGGYEQTLTEAVIDIFDMFTVRHSWNDTPYEKNIHYFNGWKTNKAFKVGKRVVIPIRASYGNAFIDWGRWRLDYRAAETLRDIDTVMNYFDGMSEYTTLQKAIEAVFSEGKNKGESTYFKFICHKKGTIHLTFKNLDILRRFNVCACRGKGWLPEDYGAKAYAQLSHDKQAVIDEFEGKQSYSKHVNKPVFANNKTLQIAA